MSLKIRMARGGAKKRPFYRIVVADSRSPRDGRFIEKIGTYNPMLPKDGQRVTIDLERRSQAAPSFGARFVNLFRERRSVRTQHSRNRRLRPLEKEVRPDANRHD